MLREFAKASEAEIWTRVRCRYLTSFAGLHFKNEPGLTELDAAKGRRNRLSRRIRRSESANRPWSWARRQTAYARFYRHEGIMISTFFVSSKFVTNRNHSGHCRDWANRPDPLRRHGKWRPPLPSRRQRRIRLFGTCNALLCPKVNHLNDTEYNHSLPPYSSALIHVSSHFYVVSNELRSPGERPEFSLKLFSNTQTLILRKLHPRNLL